MPKRLFTTGKLFINIMIMASVKSYKGVNLLFSFPLVFFLTATFSSFAQTKQSYRNHEEIDVGGGMKVEILKCTGEGPTEECDCIYFTDKRQNGTRMKQNANRIKEEERAANLAKAINNPQARKSKPSSALASENRTDKKIPSSIAPKPKTNAPGGKPTVTLQEAARKADSVAKASSQKLKETLAKETSPEDSSEMDRVYIPKVTETGGTRLEASIPKPGTESTAATDSVSGAKETPKDVAVNTISSPVVSPDVAAKSPIPGNTSVNSTPSGNNTAPPEAAPKSTVKDTSVNAAPPVGTNVPQPTSKTTIKDTSVTITAPAESVAPASADTAEHNWVKQYDAVKSISDNSEKTGIKTVQEEGKLPQAAATTSGNALKTTLKDEQKTVETNTITPPATANKTPKKKEEKVEEAPAKAANTSSNQNNVTTPVTTNNPDTTVIKQSLRSDSVAVANANTVAPSSKGTVKNTTALKTEEISKENVPIPQQSSPAGIAAAPGKDLVETTGAIATNTNSTANTNASVKENPAAADAANASTSSKNVIGKTAEVNAKGEWEKVTIIDKESEYLYKVHYKGTSADHDEWVAVSQIRNIDSTVNTQSTNKPVKTPKVNINCSFEAPAPPVYNGDKFSERLAKRKIYDNYMADKKGNNSVKTGVTFLSLKAEDPYVNTVSISATNNLEVKLSSAPAGAMIYPVTAQYKLCEQVLGKTSSKTLNGNFACFRNKLGLWTCVSAD